MAASSLQVFLARSWDGQIQVCNVDLNTGVTDLFERASGAAGVAVQNLRLSFCGKKLHRDSNLCLWDNGICCNDTISIALLLPGGINPLEQLRIKKSALRPLQGFISLTNEPDMVTLDDDPNENRAKMPCGHVIGTGSMTSFARSYLDRQDRPYRFICPDPRCNREWDYFLVRHVACLTTDEQKEFETKISENFLLKNKGVQQCPGCGVYCERKDPRNNSVRCQFCSKNAIYDFCWACRGRWRSGGPGIKCGNPTCDGEDPRLKYLRACPKKMIGTLSCPTIRACPSCGMLIEHMTACPRMRCTMCRHEYCHACLQQRCGHPHVVAPVQTKLPGME